MLRRSPLPCIIALATYWSAACAPAAVAQSFPAKPIRLVAPFSAGGGGDTVARLIAQKLGEVYGQQVIVDNRAGANNIIGTEVVARAAPDGYTILIVNNSHASNTYVFRKLPYDAVADFAPISLVALTPYMVMVHPSLPARSVRELIELARAKPGQLNYASAGIGSVGHFATELLRVSTRIDIVHIPYKGITSAVIDTIAGATQLIIASPLSAQPQVKAGKLRALAVTTAARSRAMSELPTLQESGVAGYEFSSCYALLAPRAVPDPVIASLNQSVTRVLQQKDVQARLASEAADPAGGTPQQLADYLGQQSEKFAKLVKAIGLKPE